MDFEGKLAFITGGASGIGLALAKACAEKGMRVLVTDIEEPALDSAAKVLSAAGGEIITRVLDVSDRQAYAVLSAEVLDEYGAPYLLFNNAGIATSGPAASATPDDWQWLVSVNILGVGYGLSYFVPDMIASGQGGCVINTASITGLLTSPGTPSLYGMTKHAVLAITETLTHELRNHNMHAVAICPGSVNTHITRSERIRPDSITENDLSAQHVSAEERALTQQFVDQGLTPEDVAARVFKAIEEKRTYVVTHPEYKDEIVKRHRMIEDSISGKPEGDVELIAIANALLQLQPLT